MAYNGHRVRYKHFLLDLAAVLHLSWLTAEVLTLETARSALVTSVHFMHGRPRVLTVVAVWCASTSRRTWW